MFEIYLLNKLWIGFNRALIKTLQQKFHLIIRLSNRNLWRIGCLLSGKRIYFEDFYVLGIEIKAGLAIKKPTYKVG